MRRTTLISAVAGAALIAACETVYPAESVEPAAAEAPPPETAETTDTVDATEAVEEVVETAEAAAAPEPDEETKPALTSAERLALILEKQPEDVQARYGARNPAETLAFFEIEPGMTVAEALPGGGWYTKLLLPYVGPGGQVIGAQYPNEIWSKFGFGEDWAQDRVEASDNWTMTAGEWDIEGSASVDSYNMTLAPETLAGSLDAVLFIRALHNLHRFNPDTGWFDATLAETFTLVKPGGVVGVVQHRAPDANPDSWADGNNGYLKQSRVIEAFEAAGFVLEATSEINANPADTPNEEDFVWRLPPSLAGTDEGSPERAAMEAIGESDRMTLRFRKPV